MHFDDIRQICAQLTNQYFLKFKEQMVNFTGKRSFQLRPIVTVPLNNNIL